MRPFNTYGDFQMDLVSGRHIRQAAARGAGVTLLSSMTGLLMQIAATMILARLLAPSDFGLLAMVTTFSLLLMNFGLNGFTEAIVQRESMSHGLASNLFWLNLSIGCALTVLFALAGPLLARLFHNSEVKQVAAVTSLTILFTSLSVVHLALLKRGMRFSIISANDVSSRLISVGVSIVLGLFGWGYWALVVGAVALPLSSSIGAWWLCRWIPRLPVIKEGHGGVLTFATHTYGRFTLNYFARNADNLLVGWRFNSVALGLYKKAYDLFALPASQLVSSITIVAVATLSRLNKDEARRHAYLVSSLQAITFLGMGLAAVLTLTGKDLIRVLLGPKWGLAGEIFEFFGPGVGSMMLYYSHGWIHLAIGRTDRWLRWGFVEVIFTCLLFFACLPWGPKGIAVAWTLSFWILTIPALWYAGRPISFGVGPVLRSAWKYVASSLFAFVAVHVVVYRWSPLAGLQGLVGALVRILVSSGVLAIVYLGVVVLLDRGFESLHLILSVVRQILSSDKLAPTFPSCRPDVCSADLEREFGKQIQPIRHGAGPLVSILIPAYNAEAKALREQEAKLCN